MRINKLVPFTVMDKISQVISTWKRQKHIKKPLTDLQSKELTNTISAYIEYAEGIITEEEACRKIARSNFITGDKTGKGG